MVNPLQKNKGRRLLASLLVFSIFLSLEAHPFPYTRAGSFTSTGGSACRPAEFRKFHGLL